MNLVNIYPEIKKAIIAFIPKYSLLKNHQKPMFPPIFGTGFFINHKGLAVTNNHVVESFRQVIYANSISHDDFGVSAVLFYQNKNSITDIIFDIKKVIKISEDNSQSNKSPDLAFVELDVQKNPYLELESEDYVLNEGYEVATSGFPSGRYALMGPNGYFQISPTLQRGIISAILPYPKKKPHAFAVNVMTHGGASGSPVFSTNTGKVCGILFSVLTDASYSDKNNKYIVPTNISYAIPSHQIIDALKNVQLNEYENKKNFSDFLELKGIK